MSTGTIEMRWAHRCGTFFLAVLAIASDGERASAQRAGPPAVTSEASDFWSFRPIHRPVVPRDSSGWARNPIDALVLDRLKEVGLEPAPAADKAALLRRAHYDLLGLPPSPELVREFLADDSPLSYVALIDRLLASPHYGEKWGRHWLDLVRYAESNSFERDGAKPFVWRYRDYVVDSFDADKPYDQFVCEQLAGDEIEPATPERIIATGYHRLGPWDDEPADPLQALYDDLDDIVATTGQVFLGLTINCARCHDHMIDPFPQTDYYRFLAFFRNVQRYGVRNDESVAAASLRSIAPQADQRRQAAEIAVHTRRLTAVEERIRAIEAQVRDDLSPVEREEFAHEQNRTAIVGKRVPAILNAERFREYVSSFEERDRFRKFRPAGLAQALCVKEERGDPPPTFVLTRGNPHAPGARVEPGFPSVLGGPAPSIRRPSDGSSGRRLTLGRWIASRQNPLAARVIANRVWQFHFGRGIVRTPSDFGYQGSQPTHPALLDWLACELVEGGWRLKDLHRLIMTSSTYRMSAEANPSALAQDPENDAIWRFDRRRLTAEEIRDSILAASGTLNLERGGPSIHPTIPADVLAGQSRPGSGWGQSSPAQQARRSVYIHIKRSLIHPMLASFDFADTDSSCAVRFASTQPTQALGMLNGSFLNEQAMLFAHDLVRQTGREPAGQVALALWRILQREPKASEIERGVHLLRALEKEDGLSTEQALARFCLVALNLNEFIYLD